MARKKKRTNQNENPKVVVTTSTGRRLEISREHADRLLSYPNSSWSEEKQKEEQTPKEADETGRDTSEGED